MVIYPLSLLDALPISQQPPQRRFLLAGWQRIGAVALEPGGGLIGGQAGPSGGERLQHLRGRTRVRVGEQALAAVGVGGALGGGGHGVHRFQDPPVSGGIPGRSPSRPHAAPGRLHAAPGRPSRRRVQGTMTILPPAWPDSTAAIASAALAKGNVTTTCGSTSPYWMIDRKSTRLNSSHVAISYAVYCLKKKTYKGRN